MRYSVLAFLLCMFSGAALAQTAVPNTFTPGTPAQASQVNANFQALTTAIDALSARVAILEGTLTSAEAAGTYSFSNLSVDISGTPTGVNGATLEHRTMLGTVTLNTDGTGSFSGVTENVTNLGLPGSASTSIAPLVTTSTTGGGSMGITWSLSGSTIILNSIPIAGNLVSLSFQHAAGGRLFISVGSSNLPGGLEFNYVYFLSRN